MDEPFKYKLIYKEVMKEILIDHNFSTSRAINKIHKLRGKSLVVVKNRNIYQGILSNYDLRKAIINNSITNKTINKIYNKKSKFIFSDELKKKISSLSFQLKEFAIIPIIDRKTHKLIDILDNKKLINYKNRGFNKINCPVVIMAGGKGTRLKPYTEILPKPLLPINNKPIIKHILEKFNNYGPSSFLVTLNYKSELLNSYFRELKDENTIPISTFVENKPLGTVGGLYFLRKKINKNFFFLTNCDTIINADYYDILQFHIKNQNDLTIVVANKNFKIPYGICSEKNNKIELIEKPNFKLDINTGFYLMSSSILNFLKKKKYLDFNLLMDLIISKNKKIGIYKIKEKNWIDVGQIKEYKNHIINFAKKK
jgi:dTDP-glucose pyrophosphorylase